jgi:cell division protein FtsB
MSRRLLENVVAAVLTALSLGILGAAWSTYLAVRDTQRDVREIRKELGGLREDLDVLWAETSDLDQRSVREAPKKKP